MSCREGSIELDNVILSGGHDRIKMKKIGSRYTVDVIATASMFVYWMIEICNSGHRVQESELASSKSAFA
jgi:hypothetical protein